MRCRDDILGEVSALALVLEAALFDGLHFLLLLGLLDRGGSGLGSRGGLSGSSRGGLDSRGSSLGGSGSGCLGGGLDDRLGGRSLDGHLNGLLCVGHCLKFLLEKQGISRKKKKGIGYH